MRLIDADELMAKVNSVRYLRKLKAKSLCDECKEIEAIPLEFVKEQEHFYCHMQEFDKAQVLIDLLEIWTAELLEKNQWNAQGLKQTSASS